MKKSSRFLKNINGLLAIIPVFLLVSVISCSSDDTQVTPEDLSYLEGDYVGTWNSKTPTVAYIDFGISSKIQVSDTNEITGVIFYTKDFTVCCSEEENDGTFKMEINSGAIKSFVLNDTQTNCIGTFKGTGKLREVDKALVIDFTGDDCRGDHIGQIILVKQ